jgi:hypothetical protein
LFFACTDVAAPPPCPGCGKTSLINNLARVMGLSGEQDEFQVSVPIIASTTIIRADTPLLLPHPCTQVLDFHAGVAEVHIEAFVERCEAIAAASVCRQGATRVLAFLDEVNTCDHLGLITELLCSSRLNGRRVHSGVTFIAAVNPYRLRAAPVHGVGLQHAAASVDPLSRLVYRVHPLPETLMTSLWDFGAVSGAQEELYLSAMMTAQPVFLSDGHASLATVLVAASHRFLAAHEAECCSVSLRDPQRFKKLAAWFKDKLALREGTRRAEVHRRRTSARAAATYAPRGSGDGGAWRGLFGMANDLWRSGTSFVMGASNAMFSFGADASPQGGADEQPEMSDGEIELRAIILACAHCYRARLATREARSVYLDTLAHEIRKFSRERRAWWYAQHGRSRWAFVDAVTAAHLQQVILSEQLDYLARMTMRPAGCAANEALKENVFVLLVCILNRIPVFLVGKPGCSKSLAMKLIEDNLRGADSRDDFFRNLPQVYLFSFQGSFDSTSDGVRSVFDNAARYAAKNADADDVVPVVLLDEVGLAEVSPHNPLKVLHALLETRDGSALPYAVVGISNWSLDAAKMNRAVLLSRPDPTVDDLIETAVEIAAGLDAAQRATPVSQERLATVARTYARFQAARAGAPDTKNFHGLRDFYSFCKCLARMEAPTDVEVVHAIHNCFGGMPGSAVHFERIMRDLGGLSRTSAGAAPRVTDLVRANLCDPFARHLLLVTRGDAALGVLHACFPSALRPPVVMIGSSFDDDMRPSYTYEVLSKIILYMEIGQPICLYRHERVYGSLYDMLNQANAAATRTRARPHIRARTPRVPRF